MKKKARQANIELLRLIAMLMVVVVHYFVKGQAVVPMVDDTGAVNLIVHFLELMCFVTINVYMLISGYFFVGFHWKLSRLFTLWLQVMFYSVGVPVVCCVLGIGEVRTWGLYDWVNVLFPVQMEHYWFITAYVILYLFVPALSLGVQHMTKKQHQLAIAGLLLVFSVPKSILPIGIPTDRYGYDFGWFLCVFMVAAYIRLYGIPFLSNKKRGFAVYFLSIAGLWGICVLCGVLSRKGLPLTYAMEMPFSHNHIFMLTAAVGLFYAFRYIQIPEGRISDIICKISSHSLGVYLLHENLALRTKWQFWAGIDLVKGEFKMFPHMVITVIVVFVVGIVIDFVRECIFKAVSNVWKTARH